MLIVRVDGDVTDCRAVLDEVLGYGRLCTPIGQNLVHLVSVSVDKQSAIRAVPVELNEMVTRLALHGTFSLVYGRPSCPAPHRYLESADRGTRLTYQPVLEYGKGCDRLDVVIRGKVDPDDVPERTADGAHEGRDGREREEALVSNEGVPDLDLDGLAYGRPSYSIE